ncbi:trypsin-like peptidase domain-containing protein [Streptomyces bambusae]|uniref:trypsin-like serine peptidase n=1 Tax=Streptomyces bambusae TaxID=1550616 RepID=UPI001CFFF032|nr:trypsin-like peptidase domain-containing protein [Streptomyces bambusae]MCB5169703.1 trypsin-like peptidase domain-containing protein [Streptomyces bambusae]
MLLALTGTGAAGAVTPPGGSGSTAAAAEATSSAPADNSAAADSYWTPERMRKAIPLDVLPGAARAAAAAGPQAAPVGQPWSSPGARPTLPSPSGLAATAIPTSAATGKVFFKNPKDGRNYVCSASALNSSSKQLVVTAGHCVHGGRGGKWMTNWVYVPRYHNGSKPYGSFAAKQFRAFKSWTSEGKYTRDVAMVTTWPRNGKKLVNVTGGHGISVNYDRTQNVYVIGYPRNHSNGQIQMFCHGGTSATAGSTQVKIRCNFHPGSSGGPWLRRYNTGNGLGYVNGVTSLIAPSTGWNYSPYFDEYVSKMFKEQGRVT